MAAAEAPPDAPEASAATASASVLGADELRLIFAQLLTTRDCEKDFGRCARGAAVRATRS